MSVRFTLRIVGSLAVAAAAIVAAPQTVPAADASFVPLASLGSLDGAGIYGHICQGCHMPGAVGAVGAGRYPKLAGDSALASWRYVAITVLNGRKAMPAFGAGGEERFETHGVQLTDAQVADVVNYLRSNFGNRFKGTVTAAQIASLPHPTGGTGP